MLFNELFAEYVQTNPAVRSPNTERLLRTVVNHFARFIGERATASDLTDRNLVAYMRHRRLAGRKEITIENEAAKLKAMASFAAVRGIIPPLQMKVTHARPPAPRALLKHQIRSLFQAAERAKGRIGGIERSTYFVAFFSLCWDTAERAGAIHQLDRGDIDLAGREVLFRNRKGNGRELRRPIRRSTAKALAKLWATADREKPFAVVKFASIYFHMNKIMAAAGIPPEKRNKFHALRRSHASYVHAAGGDAREALDHSSEAVTWKWYLDPRIIFRKRGLDLLFSPLGIWSRIRAACWFW